MDKDRKKEQGSGYGKAIPYLVLLGVAAVLVFLNLRYQDRWLDSDMAAEMIFSRQLSREGGIIASTHWYYSTEFRVLYTQLLMGPLFRFLSSWHVIRTITNLVFYVLMFVSYLFAVKPLKLKKSYALMTGLVLYLPFSETMVLHMQIGNTYMSHVIILMFFFGLFLRLAGVGKIKKDETVIAKTAGNVQKASKDSKKAAEPSRFMRSVWLLCYMALALVCGMSGVRYLFTMQCPLLLATFLYCLGSDEFASFREEPNWGKVRDILKCDSFRYFLYSILGAAGAVVGYGINVAVISKKFVFQTYGATNFIEIYYGELFSRLQDAIGTLLMLFGYIPSKSVLSLRGLVSLFSFVILGLFIYAVVVAYKKCKDVQKFWVLFLICAFAINVFVFVFTTSTMVSRYYITILIFALPVLGLFLQSEKRIVDRFCFIALLVACLGINSLKCVYSLMTIDKNADRKKVAAFLVDNGYTFGYATFSNAGIMTELTNGVLEVANIWDPLELNDFKWSSPEAYYEEGYWSGEVFLILSEEETEEFAQAPVVTDGKEIYRENGYVVYLFDGVQDLKDHAQSRVEASK